MLVTARTDPNIGPAFAGVTRFERVAESYEPLYEVTSEARAIQPNVITL